MTQASFNLVDEPWIPCVTSTGKSALLGLEDTLVRAHELREIYDDSPLVTVTLHRLLLAVLHHLLQGPEDMSAWAEVWNGGNGRFDGQRIHDYLHDAKRHRRFDLFDEEWPFYQCSQVPFARDVVKKKGTFVEPFTNFVGKLPIEHAANDTLFHHEVEGVLSPLLPAEAARLVIARQSFSTENLATCETPDQKSVKFSPLVKGAVAVIRGQNLFQTLLLNLHAYNGSQGEPYVFNAKYDLPAWERTEYTQPCDRTPNGYLDLLTWQSRRIRLQPEVSDDGTITVRTAVVMKGEQFIDGFYRRGHETMVAFTQKKDAPAKQDPFPAVGFSEERTLWRSSLALFQTVDQVQFRPKTVDWLDQLRLEDKLPLEQVFPMDLFGLSSDQAKVLLWRHERLPLSLRLISSLPLLLTLQEALASTEQVRKVLWQTATEFARILLLQDESKQPGTEQKKDIQKIVDSLGLERRYWAVLDAPFHRFLEDLGRQPPPESQEIHDSALADWNEQIRAIATDVFRKAIAREDKSARSLKAFVSAERRFYRLLREALPQATEFLSAESAQAPLQS